MFSINERMIKLNPTLEKKQFEQRFPEELIEIIALTGHSGVGGSKFGESSLWTASISLLAWKELHKGQPVVKEEISLDWLVTDEEFEESRDLLQEHSIVKLQVRKAEDMMMLVRVLDNHYQDDELERILHEELKPVYYNDEILGQFELEKSVNIFKKKITWLNEDCSLYFNWDENKAAMDESLKTAHELFNNQAQWDKAIRNYAAKELVDLANDWLQDNEEAEITEITKELFVELMSIDSISVYNDGEFEIFFSDGDMFWGHSIIVNGDINGNFTSAEIAG